MSEHTEWWFYVEGRGPSHNGQPADADVCVHKVVKELKASGHEFFQIRFCVGGYEENWREETMADLHDQLVEQAARVELDWEKAKVEAEDTARRKATDQSPPDQSPPPPEPLPSHPPPLAVRPEAKPPEAKPPVALAVSHPSDPRRKANDQEPKHSKEPSHATEVKGAAEVGVRQSGKADKGGKGGERVHRRDSEEEL